MSRKVRFDPLKEFFARLDEAAWKWREIAECNRRLEEKKKCNHFVDKTQSCWKGHEVCEGRSCPDFEEILGEGEK